MGVHPEFKPQVIWRPIPGSSQEIALDSRAQHTLYTGARGPGKTDTQLMRFRRRVGMGYGAYWRGIIFDREYKNLEDLVNKSKRWFYNLDPDAKFKESPKDLKWVWPTGEELLFRAVRKPEDYWDYHGHEYPFIGWNELTKFPTGELYEAMSSTNRSSYMPDKDGWVGGYFPKDGDLPVGPDGAIPPPIPLEVFSTANPWGPGHAWVKRKFIDVAKYGHVHRRSQKVFNPKTQQREEIETSQVAIFGTYRENIYLDPVYVATLENIKDKNKRRAWLAGSWDIVAGGAIDDLWAENVHIVPRFEIPNNWHVNRCFDWASTQPFSIGWFAESNGEEIVMPDGSRRYFPRGTIIQISEWYGSEEIGTNIGLKLSATAIAEEIKRREKILKGAGALRPWVHGAIWGGPADNQIGNQSESGTETIKTKMANVGVHWQDSDKSKGSRVIGLELLRDRLDAALKKDDKPGFYIMDNCLATRALLPTLPRDESNPDDIDTESEDHIWDMIRYRLLQGANSAATDVRIGILR